MLLICLDNHNGEFLGLFSNTECFRSSDEQTLNFSYARELWLRFHSKLLAFGFARQVFGISNSLLPLGDIKLSIILLRS